MPTSRNNAPVDSPWLTIWSTPPAIACSVNAKVPSTTNPRCDTDEYATRRFTSVWMSATIAPYTIPISAITEIASAKYREASGNSDRLNLIRPYAPIFSSTAARITEPAVGASVWASGSHVWSGNSGTFTPNATRNARNSHRAVVVPIPRFTSSRTSKVGPPGSDPDFAYRTRIATSRNAEPNIVYRKNFTVA